MGVSDLPLSWTAPDVPFPTAEHAASISPMHQPSLPQTFGHENQPTETTGGKSPREARPSKWLFSPKRWVPEPAQRQK